MWAVLSDDVFAVNPDQCRPTNALAPSCRAFYCTVDRVNVILVKGEDLFDSETDALLICMTRLQSKRDALSDKLDSARRRYKTKIKPVLGIK